MKLTAEDDVTKTDWRDKFIAYRILATFAPGVARDFYWLLSLFQRITYAHIFIG